ncbi:globin, partial [Rhizobium leguminosarum]
MTEKVTTLYQAIGGDPVVRALTHRFYELVYGAHVSRLRQAVHQF